VTRPLERLGGERGVALILALVVLMTLSALALAFLSLSALEPRISRNLHDTSRARWLAEAGIELGYGLLAATDDDGGTWSALLATATGDAPWVDLPSLDGCTVSIRSNPQTAAGVIVRSAGTVNTTTRTIEITVRRVVVRSESDPPARARQIVSDWREF
jgi:Tfp pilus assembly protein PilX